MRKILKIILYTFIIIILLIISILAYGMTLLNDDIAKDSVSLFAINKVYHGSCNEVFVGNNKIYVNESKYTLVMYDGEVSEIHKSTAEFYKETWDSINEEKDRIESNECLNRRKENKRKYLDKKRSKKNADKKLNELIKILNK